MGPIGVNDDFTNRSVTTGIANVPRGGVTTAAGIIVFRNTVQNTGGGDDVFRIGAPIAPAGFVIEVSTDHGDHYLPLNEPHASVISRRQSLTQRLAQMLHCLEQRSSSP